MWGRSTKQRRAAVKRKRLAAFYSGVERSGLRLGAVVEVTTFAPLPERPTLADVIRSVYGATTRTVAFPRGS